MGFHDLAGLGESHHTTVPILTIRKILKILLLTIPQWQTGERDRRRPRSGEKGPGHEIPQRAHGSGVRQLGNS